jgi:glycosyltransferase involved in cell wall biosynthesis
MWERVMVETLWTHDQFVRAWRSMMTTRVKVSVVMTSYKSAWSIEEAFRSIRSQTYPDVEIVLTDNFSRDGTSEIVRKYGVRFFELKCGLSKGLNNSISQSAGEYIFYMDTDMVLTPTIIADCVRKCEEDFDAVVIPEQAFGEGFWAQCKAVEKRMYVDDPLVDAARFFKRSVLNDVGFYDETLETCQDWDMHDRIQQLGYKIGHIDSVIRHNEGHPTLRTLFRKKFSRAQVIQPYFDKHKGQATRRLGPVKPAFLVHWRTWLFSKYGLGFLLMKVIENSGAILGYLVGWAKGRIVKSLR